MKAALRFATKEFNTKIIHKQWEQAAAETNMGLCPLIRDKKKSDKVKTENR